MAFLVNQLRALLWLGILTGILGTGFSAPAFSADRYASIVIDASTNQILYQVNPDAPRYPASLTKMMTLYLTFEALEKGRLSMNQQLPVSAHAASMPATNLSLNSRDRIDVKTAIESLVVRSANDVSVVLAEAIDGTDDRFAVRMTNKARQLGMRNTTFRNPNGLPDPRQVTTARDLAKLSLALRRDFPQYYHFFKTLEFSYKGKSYQTHNRVMRDYPGADGLKTGYINLSGFNLATSVVRPDGYSIVAVVMGGKSSKARDDHMKDLLNRSLRQLAENRKNGGGNTQFASLGEEQEQRPTRKKMPISPVPVPILKPGSVEKTGLAQNNKVQPAEQETVQALSAPLDFGKVTADNPPAMETGIGDTAEFITGARYSPSAITEYVGNWGIQVGAFSESRDAFMAAVNAKNLADRELDGSQILVVKPAAGEGRIFRARIVNITKSQAHRACRVLIARKESCFVYQVNG